MCVHSWGSECIVRTKYCQFFFLLQQMTQVSQCGPKSKFCDQQRCQGKIMIVSYGWEIFPVDCKYRHNSHPSSCVCPLGMCFYSSSYKKKSLFFPPLESRLSCNLLWAINCGGSDAVPDLSSHLNRPSGLSLSLITRTAGLWTCRD